MSKYVKVLLPCVFFLILAVIFPSVSLAQAAGATPFQLGVVLSDPATVGAFETAIGRKANTFLWYQAIDETLDANLLAPAAAGRTIQLAWIPIPAHSASPVNLADYRLSNFASGRFDSELRRWARELRAFGYPVQFRPMSEMNGNWVSWSGSTNGNTPADFIAAWRHMHDIFVQEGATNVKWIWSPNRDGSTADAVNTFNNYFPGDGYLDFVGFSGYNWGTMYNTPAWVSTWQSATEVLGYSYDVAVTRTQRPIVISEMASTELGGSKALWITDLFSTLPVRFPRIVGLNWFNLNKETDWRVESSAASLAAFRAGIQNLDIAVAGCGYPDLALSLRSSYWASYADYRASVLTVSFDVRNLSLHDASNLVVTGSASSDGASSASRLPLAVSGMISVANPGLLTMKYNISSGMQAFSTATFATATDACGNSYTYPGAYVRV